MTTALGSQITARGRVLNTGSPYRLGGRGGIRVFMILVALVTVAPNVCDTNGGHSEEIWLHADCVAQAMRDVP